MAKLSRRLVQLDLSRNAEERAAGAVPAGAEMEPPPVVEAEVFPHFLFLFFRFLHHACLISDYFMFG